MFQRSILCGLTLASVYLSPNAFCESFDLSEATIVVQQGERESAEEAAAIVLSEEIEKRSGYTLPIQTDWPSSGRVIAITSAPDATQWGKPLPESRETRVEGYRLLLTGNVIWILGADSRGTLYGAGDLLRHLDWSIGSGSVEGPLDIQTAPASSIRGHQLGYRHRANSWDAWTREQFDQYIRELALFGVNSIENIPFEDSRISDMMKYSRRDMNRIMSEICARYGLDYWVWTAADYDLGDDETRAKALAQHEELYRDCEELTGIFVPGGDPGNNPPELVLPFLADIAERLHQYHPAAKVWLSLQHFDDEEIEYVQTFLDTESPDWFGGLVAGPSSPPIPETRQRLHRKYKYRLYPDITHNKICQYPVPWWDQALALTLGREAINPRPTHYAYIHNWFAPHSDGFISYSDGVHDDVNKAIWSSLGWDPSRDVREILIEYNRLFLSPRHAEAIADGILALENNWDGPLATNGSVESTFLLWQKLERELPELSNNWRWQMCLVRAYYDTYIRRRLLRETQLERDANAALLTAPQAGAEAAMKSAESILSEAVSEPAFRDQRERIEALCKQLFETVQLQTSVPIYGASGAERGAFLDFVDYPLNNRWWLLDEFNKVEEMSSESEKVDRLMILATWETPGHGSFYDDVGNPAQSPRVKRSEFIFTEPGEESHPEPILWWWDNGQSRARLSWQVTMNYPEAVVYDGLDPSATYTIRCGGYGKFLMRIDGDLAPEAGEHFEMGHNQTFSVPKEKLEDGRLVLTWDRPTDEGHLNWRKHSRLAEIWLIKD